MSMRLYAYIYSGALNLCTKNNKDETWATHSRLINAFNKTLITQIQLHNYLIPHLLCNYYKILLKVEAFCVAERVMIIANIDSPIYGPYFTEDKRNEPWHQDSEETARRQRGDSGQQEIDILQT